MRHLNNREKQIINHLVKEFSIEKYLLDFNDFLCKILKQKHSSIEFKNTYDLTIRAPDQNVNKYANEIIEIVFLIDTLRKEHYISLISDDIKGLFEPLVIGVLNEEQDGEVILSDENFFNLFNKLYASKLYLSAALIDLNNNNFVTDEEKRHKKIMKATWTSIIVAFLIGVSGILINIFQNREKDLNETIKAKKGQTNIIKVISNAKEDTVIVRNKQNAKQ